MTPLMIPLGVFAMVILIVAITHLVKLREKEMDVQQKLHLDEMEHQRRMRELDLEMERIKQGK
jgi:hypothetical protein